MLPVLQSSFAPEQKKKKKSNIFHEGEIHIPYGKISPLSVKLSRRLAKIPVRVSLPRLERRTALSH